MRAILLLTLLAAACSSKREAPSEPNPAAASPAATAPAADVARGALMGTVTYAGKAPVPHRIDRSSDPACEPREIIDDAIVVNSNDTLRNVLVRVVDADLRAAPPSEPVVVTQKDCVYRPRVQGAVEGQPIEFHNDDGTVHNIHGYDLGTQPPTALYNEAQIEGAPPIRKPTTGRDVVKIACDIHPWMRASVIVSPHPFFAVTGEDGAFRIDGLPIGRHTLEAWHEVLGTRRTTVDVRVEDGAAVAFSFGP